MWRVSAIVLIVALALGACTSPPRKDEVSYLEPVPSHPGAPLAPWVIPDSLADFQRNVGDRVFFDFDSSVLTAEGQATLLRQAAWFKKFRPGVVIEGHSDERGTREYNLALGSRRANAVRNYLIAQGVPANLLTIISYGKERPAVLGDNEAAWEQNRRAVSVPQNLPRS